jgi:putative transposase
MIDRSHELPLGGQAKALGISRGSIYYLARPTSDADLALMRRIDELHLEHPFAGSRMLRDMLKAEGREVGRRHVATLMKKMGVEAIYRRPNTSKPAPGHKIYPYLLRNLAVTRPNQVWAADITYVPMARGFVYLVAIVDWFSRRVLAWRLSITLSADFCVEALEEAIARHGKPEIFNTDQGSQFTSTDFTKVLKTAEIAISMDGKGAWRDNVFVERLWRTVKYEEVYLRAYTGVAQPAPRSAGISASTTARGRIHRLAGKPPIRPTSTWRRQSRRQPETGGRATQKHSRRCSDKRSHLSRVSRGRFFLTDYADSLAPRTDAVFGATC